MANYGYTPGWSKLPSVKRPKPASYEHSQPPQMFFNQPRLPPPSNQGYGTEGIKPDYLNNDNGFYGGYYAGFRAPAMEHPAPTPAFRGGRGRGFPKKEGLNRFNQNQFPRPPKMQVKKYSTSGKTAAMVLNELYPDFKEQCTYETLEATKTPRFKCSFVVCGKTFSAEGSSKKIAKQLACESALKDLRPDLTLDVPSFEKAEEEKMNALAEQAEKVLKPLKRKADANKIANSLHDFFYHLCREKQAASGAAFQPVFEVTEVPAAPSKPNVKRYLCSLALADQGKRYTHECTSKVGGKNWVIRDALLDLFKVKHEELKTVERNAILLRPGPPSQVLLQALSFYDRTVQIDVDTADEKPVDANSRFVAKCILDNEKTIIGPPEESKQKARDAVCIKVITEELELSMPTENSGKRAAPVLSPCYALHALMVKQMHNPHPDIVYSDPADISEGGENAKKVPLFKCQVTLNKKDVFEGTGQSKKAAKSAAAEQALKEFFKFDLLADNAADALSSKRPKVDENIDLCNDICTLVRTEYEAICQQQGCPLTTHIAAFIVIKPNGERSMVALGAGRNAVIDGRVLKASQGSLLIHMQCAVLARRAFLLYLHKQLAKGDDPDSMFEKSETGKYKIKPGYKIVLYSTFPPNTTRIGSEQQKLCCYGGNGGRIGLTPESQQTLDDMITSGCVNVMSIADKMLKWNHLGVQGALLSYIVDPIFISHYFIAVPSNDRMVANAVLLRFADSRKDDFIVKSAHTAIRPQGEIYHNWVADIGMLERLDPYTGRTVAGSPSRLSKTELFESWNRLLTLIGGADKMLSWSCAEAKQAEAVYTSAVNGFHEQLKKLGLGVWQRKNQQIDDFTLAFE